MHLRATACFTVTALTTDGQKSPNDCSNPLPTHLRRGLVIMLSCWNISPQYMCHRVTVIILSVCLCRLFVCYGVESAAYLVYRSNTRCSRVLYGVFLVFLLMKTHRGAIWHHLLIDATFFAPWRAFVRHKRQQRPHFNLNSMCG